MYKMPEHIAGVYAVLFDDCTLYVGQSADIAVRRRGHDLQQRVADWYLLQECEHRVTRLHLEAAWIRRLVPKHNRTNVDPPWDMADDWLHLD